MRDPNCKKCQQDLPHRHTTKRQDQLTSEMEMCKHYLVFGATCTACQLEYGTTQAENSVRAATQFQQGRKNDGEKDRWDLLPLASIKALVKVLTFGARKYAPNNWKVVPDAQERYYAAAMRHLVAYREGEWLDLCKSHGEARPDDCRNCSGQPHLANLLCNAVFLFHFGPYKEMP